MTADEIERFMFMERFDLELYDFAVNLFHERLAYTALQDILKMRQERSLFIFHEVNLREDVTRVYYTDNLQDSIIDFGYSE